MTAILEQPTEPSEFEHELRGLINYHSMENGSNSPDHILAAYLADCLKSYDLAVCRRDQWYSVKLEPGCSGNVTVGAVVEDSGG